ncbi:hypothetical protein McpSp1_10690 [Methanocorpusculaceae archaeon Sp1]|nr:hypothetical protein [Methanocorpusculaceae archaeon Sp1]
MTVTITASGILNDLLLPRWPKPSDPFEDAVWCGAMEAALGELIPLFNHGFHAAVNLIRELGLTSPVYELLLPQTVLRHVDAECLRLASPAVYDEVAYLRSSDAERILGRRTLYRLSCEQDPARTESLAQVNVGDLERILTPSEMEPFVRSSCKPARPKVVPREAAS